MSVCWPGQTRRTARSHSSGVVSFTAFTFNHSYYTWTACDDTFGGAAIQQSDLIISHPSRKRCSRLRVFSVFSPTGSTYYDNVRPLAYPDADAVLICFDVSRPETLDSVTKKVSSTSLRERDCVSFNCQSENTSDPRTKFRNNQHYRADNDAFLLSAVVQYNNTSVRSQARTGGYDWTLPASMECS